MHGARGQNVEKSSVTDINDDTLRYVVSDLDQSHTHLLGVRLKHASRTGPL
jgi:hypothetical protein